MGRILLLLSLLFSFSLSAQDDYYDEEPPVTENYDAFDEQPEMIKKDLPKQIPDESAPIPYESDEYADEPYPTERDEPYDDSY